MGDAHGEMLLFIIPARSKVSISFCTESLCFKGKVYG